jgi:protein TonB
MRNIGPVVAALIAVALLAACEKEPERPRKVQSVKLLPDTPPPPPPPPKPEDKPPPPKPDDKPPPPAPKPPDAEPQQALKSDEAAGDGPGSGLTAGTVTQDYAGGPAAAGTVVGTGDTGDAAARLAATAYARNLTRALNQLLAQQRDLKQAEYRVQVELWLTPAGAVQRAELVGSTGDAQADQALREALARYAGTGGAPPPRMPQPLRLLISNRLLG